MKLILSISCFAVCAISGVIIKGKYQKKEKLLSDYINFCNCARVQIEFLQTNLEKLIEIEVEKAGADFKNILNSYLKNIKEGALMTKLKSLNDSEWEIMQNLFNNLGKSDVKNQTALCENCKQAMLPSFETAKEKNKKEGNMWLKLFFCLAFLSLILII